MTLLNCVMLPKCIIMVVQLHSHFCLFIFCERQRHLREYDKVLRDVFMQTAQDANSVHYQITKILKICGI